MKRKCIISTQKKMFSHMAACIIGSFDGEIPITQTKNIDELFAEIDSDSELFIIIDPRTFGFEVETVCSKIYAINPDSMIICMCLETCNKFFGLRLFRCGVNCVVSNFDSSKELLTVMKNALKGMEYYPQEIRDAIKRHEHVTMREFSCALSARERRVFVYLVNGEQTKYIALALGIKKGTVWAMTSRIVQKLGATSRDEAIKTAIDTGLFGK